ncbi:MAG: 4-oxalocrotonate tautomerase family protein [Burkholderiales bacterium]|nr:4-oxalocrotonate tautomerase family protein [Burkholderiales bacterium]
MSFHTADYRSAIMPLVTIELLPGRSAETKHKMAEAITEIMETIAGGSREHCWVLFRETAAENWAIGGETLASEAFKAKVAAYKKRVKGD